MSFSSIRIGHVGRCQYREDCVVNFNLFRVLPEGDRFIVIFWSGQVAEFAQWGHNSGWELDIEYVLGEWAAA